jgi:hypothetical protein
MTQASPVKGIDGFADVFWFRRGRAFGRHDGRDEKSLARFLASRVGDTQ